MIAHILHVLLVVELVGGAGGYHVVRAAFVHGVFATIDLLLIIRRPNLRILLIPLLYILNHRLLQQLIVSYLVRPYQQLLVPQRRQRSVSAVQGRQHFYVVAVGPAALGLRRAVVQCSGGRGLGCVLEYV